MIEVKITATKYPLATRKQVRIFVNTNYNLLRSYYFSKFTKVIGSRLLTGGTVFIQIIHRACSKLFCHLVMHESFNRLISICSQFQSINSSLSVPYTTYSSAKRYFIISTSNKYYINFHIKSEKFT